MNAATWSPTPHDHLLYQWVKLEGRSQRDAASMLGISQATVCRALQRYERWQAHAADREGGRLDHSERLRAQRCQAFDRNEIILASCLRIAHEMEGFTDVSTSTVQRSSQSGDEQNIRTRHSTIDRSGIASRFLRLAFRINMEQLKLASLDPPPPANPLTAEEVAELERAAAAIAADFAKTRAETSDVGWGLPTKNAKVVSAPPTENIECAHATPAATTSVESNESSPTNPPLTLSPPPHDSPIHTVNQMNQPETGQIAVNQEPTSPSAKPARKPKKSRPCITPCPATDNSTLPALCSPAPFSPASSSYFPSAASTPFATPLGTG